MARGERGVARGEGEGPGRDEAGGWRGRRHLLHETALQRAVRAAALDAKRSKRVGCHALRRSFATHLQRLWPGISKLSRDSLFKAGSKEERQGFRVVLGQPLITGPARYRPRRSSEARSPQGHLNAPGFVSTHSTGTRGACLGNGPSPSVK